ncbi:MAG: AraC family transcriptional regulator [Lachnospiraceae bacterium]|nr:AraC family transcriptional regulator [Lachnospiraceae bacterium]
MCKAIEYIEEHILEDITVEDIAKEVYISPFYFQKGFRFLCGFSISEYIRNRRLSLAGSELAMLEKKDSKIIDIALKYGYDSPDSFTKAFTRFHGITPSVVQKNPTLLKTFAPLKIKLMMEGGYYMEYKIVKKEAFTVIGVSKTFSYENAKKDVPKFWQEVYATEHGKYVKGMFGINIDEQMGEDSFTYWIADIYQPMMDIPKGFTTKIIPALTWAVFPCRGAMPDALQDVNTKIFSEWLPALRDYKFAAGYCIEMYDNATKYPKGTQDENYYCEIWIPVTLN